MDDTDINLDADDEIYTCWCGAKGTYDELFSDDLEDGCGGTGVLNCYCGGDMCVCHHHGERECCGCEDCDEDDDYDDCGDYED